MEKHPCPVCGQHMFPFENSYSYCPVCDWQDDAYQEEFPDEDGCANNISLNQFRAEWKAKQGKSHE